MDYEVIVVGASFAGLAVAAQLRGKRVLLVDRKPIGTGQTSACGTVVRALEALGLEDAILQVHHEIVVHTPGRTFVYPLAEPYCTFDYAVLCRRLQAQGDATFVQAAALGIGGNQVRTSRGAFSANLVVDASGWRAALGRQVAPGLLRPHRLTFGLETAAPYRANGLHFWYDPKRFGPWGVTWAFPAGGATRVGIASYQGESHLAESLDSFLGELGLERGAVHGGFIPHGLREPVVGHLFMVGDAGGQCPGVSAEGIRPALFFGTRLGGLLRLVLDGETSLDQARSAYRALVTARKARYALLCLAQRLLPRLPLPLVQAALGLAGWPPFLRWWMSAYLNAFWLEPAPGAPARRAATAA